MAQGRLDRTKIFTIVSVKKQLHFTTRDPFLSSQSVKGHKKQLLGEENNFSVFLVLSSETEIGFCVNRSHH